MLFRRKNDGYLLIEAMLVLLITSSALTVLIPIAIEVKEQLEMTRTNVYMHHFVYNRLIEYESHHHDVLILDFKKTTVTIRFTKDDTPVIKATASYLNLKNQIESIEVYHVP